MKKRTQTRDESFLTEWHRARNARCLKSVAATRCSLKEALANSAALEKTLKPDESLPKS